MGRAPFTRALLIFILRGVSVCWHVEFLLVANTALQYMKALGACPRKTLFVIMLTTSEHIGKQCNANRTIVIMCIMYIVGLREYSDTLLVAVRVSRLWRPDG